MVLAILDDVDIRQRYLGYLRIGLPKHRAARELGISNTVAQRYAATHPDFMEQVKDATGEGTDPLYEKAYELALGTECTCQPHVEVDVGRQGNAGKQVEVHSIGCRYMPPDPEMLKFMLKALQPETFGTKVTVEHEHKIELGSVEEFLELEARLRRRQQELGGGQAIIELGAGDYAEVTPD